MSIRKVIEREIEQGGRRDLYEAVSLGLGQTAGINGKDIEDKSLGKAWGAKGGH